jgi:DNA polymerase III epsilon subunit-like protein
MAKLVFLDTETDGLQTPVHAPWEIGMIIRDENGREESYNWLFKNDLKDADSRSLSITHYWERCVTAGLENLPVGECLMTENTELPSTELPILATSRVAANVIASMLADRTVIGIVPSFDERVLTQWLKDHSLCWSADHALIDARVYAAGKLGLTPPFSTAHICDLLGIEYDEDRAHAALYDATIAQAIYDDCVAGAPKRVGEFGMPS